MLVARVRSLHWSNTHFSTSKASRLAGSQEAWNMEGMESRCRVESIPYDYRCR